MLKLLQLCGSRKYPYLPKGRLFLLNLPYPKNFQFSFIHVLFLINFCCWDSSPSEFPMTFYGVCGYFLEPHISSYTVHVPRVKLIELSRASCNKWFASNWIPMLRAKDFGITKGANIGSHWKKIYGKRLLWRPKRRFLREFDAFLLLFYPDNFGQCWSGKL